MKRVLLPILLLVLTNSCAELQQVANQFQNASSTGIDNNTIAAGLREALDKGISKQVSKLTQKDGFNKNDLVRIMLPSELEKVDNALRKIGLGNLADEGIQMLNRAAEDAVKEATPIFVSAVKGITFTDAKDILLGQEDAATNYLKSSTQEELYSKFNPVIKQSFSKTGADQIWSNIIAKYNTIPLVSKVNPDLTDYVTQQALNGVFTMIKEEEKDIRTNTAARTSGLLKTVFALQDKR